jgi:hypothetical protein
MKRASLRSVSDIASSSPRTSKRRKMDDEVEDHSELSGATGTRRSLRGVSGLADSALSSTTKTESSSNEEEV